MQAAGDTPSFAFGPYVYSDPCCFDLAIPKSKFARLIEVQMETTISQKPRANKAHHFAPDAMFCSRCGSGFADALETPLQCDGAPADPGGSAPPRTLTEAIHAAENPILY